MSKGIREMAPHDVGTLDEKTILTSEGNHNRLNNSKYKRKGINKPVRLSQKLYDNMIIGNGQTFVKSQDFKSVLE